MFSNFAKIKVLVKKCSFNVLFLSSKLVYLKVFLFLILINYLHKLLTQFANLRSTKRMNKFSS